MKIEEKQLNITCRNQSLKVAYFRRMGFKKNILYLHGLGCAKEDFKGAVESEALRNHTLISFDFPGCGGSPYPENLTLNMDDLVEITHMAITRLNIDRCVLVGHSMGGLVGLLYSEKYGSHAGAFVNVEGNLAGEDCFISRKTMTYDFHEFNEIAFPRFIKKQLESQNAGFKKYGEILEKYSSAKGFYDYCPSLIQYSDKGKLIERFLQLQVPKLFIYGSENRTLSYIPQLRQGGCPIEEIPGSNHFPNYDNPAEFYRVISKFL